MQKSLEGFFVSQDLNKKQIKHPVTFSCVGNIARTEITWDG